MTATENVLMKMLYEVRGGEDYVVIPLADGYVCRFRYDRSKRNFVRTIANPPPGVADPVVPEIKWVVAQFILRRLVRMARELEL